MCLLGFTVGFFVGMVAIGMLLLLLSLVVTPDLTQKQTMRFQRLTERERREAEAVR